MALTTHQQLLDIIEFLPDATFVINKNNEVIALNRALEEMTGVVKANILGKGDYAYSIPFWGQRRPIVIDLIGEEHKEAEDNYSYIQRSGNVIFAETFVPNLYGGKGAYVWVAASALLDENGNRYGAIESVRDITDKKLAEQQLMDIIEFLPDATFVINKNNEVIAWNRALEKMTGVVKADILGKGDYAYSIPFWGQRRPIVIDLIGTENKEVEDNYSYVQRSGNVTFAEVFVPNLYGGRGAYVWVAASALLDENGNRYGAIESVRDITDKKLVEQQLLDIIEFLPDATFVINKKKEVIAWNRALEEMTGVVKADILGKGDYAYSIPFWGQRRPVVIDLIGEEHQEAEEHYSYVQRSGDVTFAEAFVPNLYEGRGAYVWVAASALLDQYGNRYGAIESVRDISDKKLVEAALRESERRFRVLTEASLAGIYIIQEGVFRYVNPAVCRIFGYTESELIGRWALDLVHSDSRALVAVNFSRRLDCEIKEVQFEFHGVRKGGAVIWCEVFGTGIQYMDRPALMGTLVDITERKRAEVSLERSSTLLHNIIDSSTDYVYVKDRELRTILCNETLANAIGKRPADLVGKTDLENGFDPDLVKGNPAKAIRGFEADDQLALSGQTVHASDEPAKVQGALRFFDTLKHPLRDRSGKIIGLFGISRDITERREIEQALRRSEAALKEAQRIAHLGSWELDLDQNEVRWSEEMFRIFSWTPREGPMPFGPVLEATHPDDRGRFMSAMDESLRTNRPFDLEYRIVRPDGLVRWIHARGEVVLNENGKAERGVGTALDITERKQAEETIRVQAEQYATLVATTQDGYLRLDPHGRLLDVNDAYCRMSGYSPDELLAMRVADLETVEAPEDVDNHMQKIMKTGFDRFESRHRKKDGGVFDVEISVTFCRPLGQFLCFARDITDLKRADEELRRAHERLRQFIDSNIIGFVIADMDGAILEANDYYLNLVGFSRQELEQGLVNWRMLTPPEWLQVDEQSIRELQERGVCTPYEKGYVLRDGSRVWILLADMMLTGTDNQMVAYVLDITDRKRAEDKVKESEKKFKSMTDTSPLAIYMSSGIEQTAEYINPTFTKLFGYTLAEVPTASHWWPLAYPDETYRAEVRAEWERKVEQAIKTSSAIEPMETVVTCKYGLKKTISWGFISTGVQDWSFGLDLTERKRAEEALRESELMSRQLYNSIPDPVFIVTLDGERFLDVNHSATELLGYSREELLQVGPAFIDALKDKEILPERFNQLRETGYIVHEAVHKCKNGRQIPVELHSRLIKLDGQSVILGIARNLTERKRTEEALRRSEEHLRLSQIYGEIGTWEADLITKEEFWSETVTTLLGFPALEKPTWDDYIATILPEDRQNVAEAIQAHLDRGAKLDVEYRIMANDGQTRWIRSIGQAERDANGTPLRLRGIAQDISERKRTEEALHLANERFHRFVESNIVGIVIVTAAGTVLEANDYFLNLIGFTRQELERGQVNWRAITPPEWLPADEQALRELREQGVCTPYEKEYVRRDGSRVPVFLACTLLPGPGEQIAVFCLDFTERKASTERIKFLAHYDELTGLPKRSLLQDRWEMALAAAERNHWRVALLFLDLDRFKVVNDSLGHPVGDQLLKAVTDRLKACLRHEDTLARTGGDEFILVLPALNAAEEAAEVAQKLRGAVQAPFLIDGHTLYVTLSIGIGLYPDDGSDFDILSRSADAALYRAKESGRDRYQFFTAELNAQVSHHLQMENALRRALANDNFELYYQPQWDMAEGRIIGLEALLRWRDPELGWVSPAKFIPLAEKNHLILPLGEWVLRAACRQNRLWQAKGLQSLPVAVNISSLQFSQAGFRQVVAEALDETGLAPKYLELELTESILMENAETTITTVNALKAMGLGLSIDDFGTGYSSLSYLKHLPIDKLKIDQSFVRDIANDPNDVMIIRAIIGLAGSLRLKVLAEGVETQEQCDFLRAEQCPEAQGYYFSRPLPADQVEALLGKSA